MEVVEQTIEQDGQLSFTVRSGHISLSDVGHPKDFKFDVWNIPARKGRWTGTIVTGIYGDYGRRVSSLILCHFTAGSAPDPKSMIHVGNLDTDYGVVAACDSEDYVEDQDLDSKTFLWRKKDDMLLVSTGFGAFGSFAVMRDRGLEAAWIIVKFIDEMAYANLKKMAEEKQMTKRDKKNMIIGRHMTFYLIGMMEIEMARKKEEEKNSKRGIGKK